jgi:hypothetical protein
VQPRPERDQALQAGLRRIRVHQHDPPARCQQFLDMRQRCLQVRHMMQRHHAEHQAVLAETRCLQQVRPGRSPFRPPPVSSEGSSIAAHDLADVRFQIAAEFSILKQARLRKERS